MSDIRDEMINDSKDFLDTVEVTTIAQECVNLKKVGRHRLVGGRTSELLLISSSSD